MNNHRNNKSVDFRTFYSFPEGDTKSEYKNGIVKEDHENDELDNNPEDDDKIVQSPDAVKAHLKVYSN